MFFWENLKMDPNNTYVIWKEFKSHGVPGWSRRYVNILVDKGVFPPPYRLSSRKLAWRLADLHLWLRTRPLGDEQPPVLWPVKTRPRGRGMDGYSATSGRQPGGRVVTGADGRRRYVVAGDAAA